MLHGVINCMLIYPSNATTQTLIFELLLVGVILFSLRRKIDEGLSPMMTQQIKGLAILAVVLSHIGYFLVADHQFLFPLSVYAGVGVDAFLVLSGFGLTVSMMRARLDPLAFYKKRLFKLFTPWWVCLVIFVLADYFILHRTYSFTEVWQAAVGFFPKANLYENIDSPLWYFTFIISYYVFFPVVFWKRFPALSAAVLYALYRFVIPNHLPAMIDGGVQHLYELHLMAFPLGMVLAHISSLAWWQTVGERSRVLFSTVRQRYPIVPFVIRLIAGGALGYAVYYFGIHSWVGQGTVLEQRGSLFTVALVVLTAVLLPLQSRLLVLIGDYSYEIYLLHWPLMYRYGNWLYGMVPAWVATVLGLALCLGLSVVLRKTVVAIGTIRLGKQSAETFPASSVAPEKTGVH